MKVGGIDNPFEYGQSPASKVGGDGDFKKIFEQKIGRPEAPAATAPIDSRTGVIEHGDKVLNLLEDYARQLADPSKTLRDIHPLVERIEKEMNTFESETMAKVNDDPELEKIFSDLAVTANVAVLKYRRGDYL